MYKEPPWAQKPKPSSSSREEWSLLEIKGGVECGTHPLKNATTTLGRATDVVDIGLAHESCSRQHARIAFDSQGNCWLKDLGSTHGTTCNKRKLPTAAIGKVESNSNKAGARGIMLFPGDVLQFGASSRLFCVQGPSEYDRGAYKANLLQQKQAAATDGIEEQQHQYQETDNHYKKQETSGGISWGMSMEDDAIQDDQHASSGSVDKTLPMELDVPEKHRKQFGRLNAMKYKLSNLETEDSRIRRKGELTDGQEKQLHRNQEREETLKKSIVDLEEALYDIIYPDKAALANEKKKKLAHKYDDEADGEDDFFDRTKHVEKDVVDDGESETTLIAKWEAQYEQQQYMIDSLLPRAEENVSVLKERLRRLEANGDDETAFFVKNDLDLANETFGKIQREQTKTQQTMDRIERLLNVVNSKIVTDRNSGYIGEGIPPSPEARTTSNAVDDEKPINSITHQEHPEMPPPPAELPAFERTMPPPTMEHTKMLPPPLNGVRMMPTPSANSSFANMPPPSVGLTTSPSPPPPSRAPQPTMPPPKMQGNPKREGAGRFGNMNSIMPPPIMPPPKRKRVVGAPSGCAATIPMMAPSPNSASSAFARSTGSTLAGIASMFRSNGSPKSPRQTIESSHQKDLKSTSNSTMGSNEDVWQAPKDQDGSGITKLNAKFAGRY